MKFKQYILTIFLISCALAATAQNQETRNRTNYDNLINSIWNINHQIDSLIVIYNNFKDPVELRDLSNKHDSANHEINQFLHDHRDDTDEAIISNKQLRDLDDLVGKLKDVLNRLEIVIDKGNYWDLTNRSGKDYEEKSRENTLQQNSNIVFGHGVDAHTKIVTHTGLNCNINLIGQSIPYYSNSNSTFGSSQINSSTTSQAAGFIGLNGELEFHVLTTSFFDFQLLGSASYSNTGILESAFGDGSSVEAYYDYNYGGSLSLGSENYKLFAEYLAGVRNSSYSSQTSIADPTGNGTDIFVQSGDANYSFQRFTGGIKFTLSSDDAEAFLKLKYSIEKPNYSSEKNIWGGGIEFRYGINISVMYFPDYPPAGQPIYTLSNTGKTSLLFVTLGTSFNLFGGK